MIFGLLREKKKRRKKGKRKKVNKLWIERTAAIRMHMIVGNKIFLPALGEGGWGAQNGTANRYDDRPIPG